MLIHELSAEECAELLTRAHLGRLGCAHDGQPYIVPISFSRTIESAVSISVTSVMMLTMMPGTK